MTVPHIGPQQLRMGHEPICSLKLHQKPWSAHPKHRHYKTETVQCCFTVQSSFHPHTRCGWPPCCTHVQVPHNSHSNMHTLTLFSLLFTYNKPSSQVMINTEKDENFHEVKHKCTELSVSRSYQYFVLLSR